jgi:acyl-CoA thioester hydrolase
MKAHDDASSDGFVYGRPIEVRFADTDAFGHVNNAVYLTYFEAGRAGYFKAVTGHGVEETAAGPASIILASTRIDYRAPAFFGEGLHVRCRTTWISRSSFEMEYVLRADQGSPHGPDRLIATGASVQVAYDYRAGRSAPLPDGFRKMVEAFEGHPIPPRPD